MFQTDSIVFMVIIPFLSVARFSISFILNNLIMLGFLSNLDDSNRLKNRGTFNLKNFPGMLSYNPIKF
ncbi:hypothetical protein RhiirA1_417120, partial [Rhizophagus irregularis]